MVLTGIKNIDKEIMVELTGSSLEKVLGRKLKKVEVVAFYQIIDNLSKLEVSYGLYTYTFPYEGISIDNPFYDVSYIDNCSPIATYGECFKKSNFIDLLKDIIKLKLTKNNYTEKVSKFYGKLQDDLIAYILKNLKFEKTYNDFINENLDYLIFLEKEDKIIINPENLSINDILKTDFYREFNLAK